MCVVRKKRENLNKEIQLKHLETMSNENCKEWGVFSRKKSLNAY